jgi:mannose-6-phosphate isomerase-like protein (cupin superfamily)
LGRHGCPLAGDEGHRRVDEDRLRRHLLSTGAKHDIHRHPNAEEVEYLMSGSGIAYVGDDAVELGPGEAVFVPQNEYHGFENTSDGEVVMAWYYAGAASLDDAGFVTRSEDEGGESPAG